MQNHSIFVEPKKLNAKNANKSLNHKNIIEYMGKQENHDPTVRAHEQKIYDLQLRGFDNWLRTIP